MDPKRCNILLSHAYSVQLLLNFVQWRYFLLTMSVTPGTQEKLITAILRSNTRKSFIYITMYTCVCMHLFFVISSNSCFSQYLSDLYSLNDFKLVKETFN